MNQIDWALTAQAIIWCILGIVAFGLYALFGSWVGRKLQQLSERYPPALPRDPMKYEGRDLTPEQKRAIAVSDSRWTDPDGDDAAFFLDDLNQPKRSA